MDRVTQAPKHKRVPAGVAISLFYPALLLLWSILLSCCPVQWLEYFLAYCGALAFEGDPIEWSKNHRWHHQNSDSPADRHSPRDGLWHAHMGWLFDESLTNTRCGTWDCSAQTYSFLVLPADSVYLHVALLLSLTPLFA